jgi:hypothetical protein
MSISNDVSLEFSRDEALRQRDEARTQVVVLLAAVEKITTYFSGPTLGRLWDSGRLAGDTLDDLDKLNGVATNLAGAAQEYQNTLKTETATRLFDDEHLACIIKYLTEFYDTVSEEEAIRAIREILTGN